ncbi:ATP-binding cassette domain-containing protein [Leifsonia shinshuensis]|uniref:ATP-binding cassette domain-containing protein n=1 Tax=Leifsonia shinshuensis TaxID=150026 RepID=UPI001F50DBA2|nr:ATP-binding cassette domain-containing protein [Leifsonia shinshuensis]MCI0156235.1 ATP-binding cassette domain-containing protein [Leifsonia shinshuensis]
MIELRNVSKSYGRSGTMPALAQTSVLFERGQFVWISGPSGSGKSTLLGIGALLLRSDSGDVIFDGKKVDAEGSSERDRLRRRSVGIVPQSSRLFPELTASQNVMLARRRSSVVDAVSALDRVGLGEFAHRKTKTLSGGQQQRVSIARALAKKPAAVFADEVSSSLDDQNAESVYRLLRALADDGRIVVAASHDHRIEAFVTSRLMLESAT